MEDSRDVGFNVEIGRGSSASKMLSLKLDQIVKGKPHVVSTDFH